PPSAGAERRRCRLIQRGRDVGADPRRRVRAGAAFGRSSDRSERGGGVIMTGSPRLETSLQIAYLLPHADSFWRWSDDGESIVWRSGGGAGKTIGFRKEIWTI